MVGGEDSESEEDLTEDDGSDGSESTHVSLNDDESVDDLINDEDDEVRHHRHHLNDHLI